MGKQRNRTRTNSSVEQLPADLKLEVDCMLGDYRNTYDSICKYIKENGYNISRSALCRYAKKSEAAFNRLKQAQEQTEKLVSYIQNNPDADFTEPAMKILTAGLIDRLATAEEEFDTMPLDKAGRLVASLARTKTYKDKVRQDMQKKADLALQEMESDIMSVIKQDEQSTAQMKEILEKARARMMAE